jgi:hypothetical protein
MQKVFIATLCVVAAGLGGVAWAGGARDATPRLRLVDATPLTVRGANFDPAEHVSVTARGSSQQQSARHAVRAGSAGGFLVRFPTIDANDCHGFAISAIGSDGHRASLARKSGECPPPTSVER